MVAEFHNAHAGLDVPQHTCHVPRAGDNLTVVDEATAGQITGMSAELSGTFDGAALFGVQVVNRANVIETATRDEVPGRRVCACHDPT